MLAILHIFGLCNHCLIDDLLSHSKCSILSKYIAIRMGVRRKKSIPFPSLLFWSEHNKPNPDWAAGISRKVRHLNRNNKGETIKGKNTEYVVDSKNCQVSSFE